MTKRDRSISINVDTSNENLNGNKQSRSQRNIFVVKQRNKNNLVVRVHDTEFQNIIKNMPTIVIDSEASERVVRIPDIRGI